MIKNLPSYKEYEEFSRQCLTQAFNMLFNVYQNYVLYDYEFIKKEVPMSEVWNHNKGTLRTSLILLHQGIESFMKSIICKTSPLLLIEKNRLEWPTLPNRDDKDFDTLYSISGEALLTTYCATENPNSITKELVTFIEDTRKERNYATHGSNNFNLEPNVLLESILKAFTWFYGKDEWFLSACYFNFKNPLFGYYDWDYEYAMSYKYLDFAESTIGRKRLNKYLNTDVAGRPYYCPVCKESIEQENDELKSKWAFLAPNKPTSTEIFCVNCQAGLNVLRKDCVYDNCQGNVVYETNPVDVSVCLTCYESQLTDANML